MTLEQFRAQVQAHLTQPAGGKSKPRDNTAAAPDLRAADELFLELLLVQANDDAIHQSIDRLAGWRKSIESRFQTQNVPEIDVDTIRFAEAKRKAESARSESQQKRLVERANAMAGRPATAPFMALVPAAASDDPPDAVEKQQKELLSQGEELITKQYKSYQFSGISLSALLWQEQQLYETELAYRTTVARDAIDSVSANGKSGR